MKTVYIVKQRSYMLTDSVKEDEEEKVMDFVFKSLEEAQKYMKSLEQRYIKNCGYQVWHNMKESCSLMKDMSEISDIRFVIKMLIIKLEV